MLTAKNRDQLRNPTLGSRVWATCTFLVPTRRWRHSARCSPGRHLPAPGLRIVSSTQRMRGTERPYTELAGARESSIIDVKLFVVINARCARWTGRLNVACLQCALQRLNNALRAAVRRGRRELRWNSNSGTRPKCAAVALPAPVFLPARRCRERKCAENYNKWHNIFFLKLQPAFCEFQTITVSECCLIKLLPYILVENILIF